MGTYMLNSVMVTALALLILLIVALPAPMFWQDILLEEVD